MLLFNFTDESVGSAYEIWQLDLDHDRAARPFVNNARYHEMEAAFSPDGRWVAYQSMESGHWEVYVRAYPAGATELVSVGGGDGAVWNPNPKSGELFYQSATAVMKVQVENGRPKGPPARLFAHADNSGLQRQWDVTPDGQRFLVVESSASELNLVSNWFEDLRVRAPIGK